MVREEERVNPRFNKEAINLSPLFILKNVQSPQNKVNYQQHNDSDATMPKETQDEVKDFYNNVKEKAEDNEHDHQTNDDPNPCAETREINCHFDSIM